MTAAASSLAQLAQQLALKHSELDRIRNSFESRLSTLQQRKEKLEAEIRQVDAEIQAASPSAPPASTPAPRMQPKPAPRMQPRPATAPVAAEERQTLAQAVVEALRTTGRAMKVQELADELVRRKFPTASQNLAKMLSIKVSEYVKKGLIAHANEGHFTLPLSKAASSTKPAKAANGKGEKTSNGHVPANGPKLKPAASTGQPSLRSLLVELLAKSKQPVKAKDLATQVLATGYKTKSTSFINVIWTSFAQMPNVENVPDKGFRLKKSATTGK